MASVLAVGIAVVDFVFAVDELPEGPHKHWTEDADIVGGGCAANAAVAIARLGGDARLAARIGDDAVGDMIAADLVAEGVDCALLQRRSGAHSSFSAVAVDAAGERQILNFRGRGLGDETGWIDAAADCGAVLADTRWSAGAVRAMELARARGVPGILDAEGPADAELLERASHVAFSRNGLLSFAGDLGFEAALLKAAGLLPGRVFATDGQRGTLFVEHGAVAEAPAFKVRAVDTLGAGDVWHGAFALALAEGTPETPAIRFANAAAALKCTAFGGRRGSPDRAAVEALLEGAA